MAYRFRKKDRSVQKGVRRIGAEQVGKAISTIDEQGDQATAVHEVRKRCKELRGLLRLVGPNFEAYADENAEFRDIGRLLGGVREVKVLEDTFAKLAPRCPQITPPAQHRFRRALEARHPSPSASERLAQARERLAGARSRITGWTLAADDWAAIGPGLMHTLIHARAALERIGGSHAPGLHHELRKQVKYHWHHLRLLRPIAPKEIKRRAELANELGDRLGDHHDLATLEAALRGDRTVLGSVHEADALEAFARHERISQEEETLRLARELLAESAESLTERLGAEWESWRN
ncbi:MAG TPA: CHAD domain-containing protein [Croceibacterium sp.]|nr:CHAD domain-containing protein [Croceibacterium sp.]